jgi:hypothetical protein
MLFVYFLLITTIVRTRSIFWVIRQCSTLKVNWCFGGLTRIQLQGWNQLETGRKLSLFSPNVGWIKETTRLSIPEVEVKVTLQPTVSRPVCLGVRRPSGTSNQFYFLLDMFLRQLRIYNFVAPSLTRGIHFRYIYIYIYIYTHTRVYVVACRSAILNTFPPFAGRIIYCRLQINWVFLKKIVGPLLGNNRDVSNYTTAIAE